MDSYGSYSIVVFDGDDDRLHVQVVGTEREVVGGLRDFAAGLLRRRADEVADAKGGVA